MAHQLDWPIGPAIKKARKFAQSARIEKPDPLAIFVHIPSEWAAGLAVMFKEQNREKNL